MKTRILIFISLLAAIMLRNVIGQESPGGGVRPANQAEVNAGTVSNKYVSPKTLSGWSGGGGGTGVTDGSKGDVDVSGSGTTWTVTGHAGSMTGVGPYTNLYGVFIGTGGVLQMESLPDLSQLSPYDMITTVDPFNFKWNSKTILALSTNTSTISSNLTVAGTNSMRVAKITGIATNSILRTAANGDIVPTTIGSGLTLSAGGTLDVAGGGGGGGAPAMSYVALPASGIVGGTQLAYSTNLSADISVTFSNLLGTNRYFLQWLSTGQKVTFNNSGALYFLDAGQGGYSESSTNAGAYEMQVWKDGVSGRTNVLFHGRERFLAAGTNVSFSTNELTGVVTVNAAGGGGAQTPWASTIDGAGYELFNVVNITVAGTNIAGFATNNALVLTNTLPAATNLQMGSPMIKLYGSGYRTTGAGGSNVMMQGIDMLPVQGTTTPTSKMRFLASTNDQTPVEIGSIDSSGNLTIKSFTASASSGLGASANFSIGVGSQIRWNNNAGDIYLKHSSLDYTLEIGVASGTALPVTVEIGTPSSTPASGRIIPGDAVGSNIAGSSLEITGGRSTGTGASGHLQFSTTTNNFSSAATTNGLVNRMTVYGDNGMVGHHFGTYYRSNSLTFIPTAAQLGVGGFWTGNSNGNLVAIYSLNGTTTAMKVLAP